jgi:hypothetical protein
MFCFTGITTVLTMTFLGLEARTDLPKVPYPTALDFFVFLSFAFILATIIQVRELDLVDPTHNSASHESKAILGPNELSPKS